jgi:hypothetical protein
MRDQARAFSHGNSCGVVRSPSVHQRPKPKREPRPSLPKCNQFSPSCHQFMQNVTSCAQKILRHTLRQAVLDCQVSDCIGQRLCQARQSALGITQDHQSAPDCALDRTECARDRTKCALDRTECARVDRPVSC